MHRVLLLLAAAVSVLALGPASSDAHPASPGALVGPAGDIVFSSSKSGSPQIWLLHPDGSETNISNSATPDRDPVWSPTGLRIAFTRGHDIWAMDADGSHQVDLTNSPNSNGGPTWSPDGTKIAFVSDRDAVTQEIYVMNADGSNVKRLTTNTLSEHDLAWSPDGTKIAFDASNGSNDEIYTVNAKTGAKLTDLTNAMSNDDDPAWSPDGSRIAFSSDRTAGANLWLMNADGTGQAAMGTPSVYAAASMPSWSPDGAELVYPANWGKGSIQLWEVAANGSDYGANGTQLTNDAGNPLTTQPHWQPVHTVTFTASPPSGAAGGAVTLSGGGFLANDRVKLVFRDAQGTKTALGTATASATGSFTFPTAVPAGAAAGKAHITATARSGLSAKIVFSVAG